MAGKDGSTWKHDYVPTNAAAAALKAHKSPGGSTQRSFLPVPASFSAPKGTGPKGAKGTALAKARAAKPTPKTATAAKKTTAKAPAKAKAAAKPQHDLSTREGRARAVASADLSTPQGRALVAKAQRASLDTTPVSHIPGSSVKAPKAPRKPATPKPAADPMAALLKTAKPKTADDYLSGLVGNATAKSAAAPSAKITEQHVRDAYEAAVAAAPPGWNGRRAESGEFVKLTELKNRLPGTEAEKDKALSSLYTTLKINLVPQSNQQALTKEHRQRSIPIGGENKHLISIPPKRK